MVGGDRKRRSATEIREVSKPDRGVHRPEQRPSSSSEQADGEAEPWQQATLRILLSYLSLHLAALSFLTIYPVILAIADPLRPIQVESFVGAIYVDLLDMDVQSLVGWIVIPLSGGLSVASLWGAEMNSKRRWLLRLTLTGIVFSGLIYVVLIWLGLGVNFWESEGLGPKEAFSDRVGTFSFRNFAVFAAALLGAIGVQLPSWIGGGRS